MATDGVNKHDPALASEQQARELLAGSAFQFMVDGLAYWPVPCKPCKGFHIIVLPVRAEDLKKFQGVKLPARG